MEERTLPRYPAGKRELIFGLLVLLFGTFTWNRQHPLRRFLSGLCSGGGGSDGVQFLVSASLRLPAGEV